MEPHILEQALRALQNVMEELAGSDLGSTTRTLQSFTQNLQDQLVASAQLGERIRNIQSNLNNYGSRLQSQRNDLLTQLDALDRSQRTSETRWNQKIKAASRNTYNIDDILTLEEKRNASAARYLDRTRGIRSQLGMINANIRNNATQQNAVNARLGIQQRAHTNINQRLQSAIQNYARMNRLGSIQQHLLNRMGSALGFNVGTIRIMSRAFGAIPTMIFIAGNAIAGLGEKVYRAFRDSGQSGTQAIASWSSAFSAFFDGVSQGVVAWPNKFAENLGMLQGQLGRMDIGRELGVEATRLTSQYKLSSEQAASIIAPLERINGFQSNITALQMQAVDEQARFQGMSVGVVYRDIANNMKYYAQYSNQGFVNFSKSVMALKKMGVEMATMEGLANRLVGDFEGSLELQAKLQTFLPGLNLDEVMFASQYGSTEQVAQALQSALRGTGMTSISQIPRSTRLMLEQLLPGQDIENLLKGGASKMKDGEPDVVSTATSSLVNSIENLLIPAFKALTTAVLLTAAAYAVGLRPAAVLTGILSGRRGMGAGGWRSHARLTRRNINRSIASRRGSLVGRAMGATARGTGSVLGTVGRAASATAGAAGGLLTRAAGPVGAIVGGGLSYMSDVKRGVSKEDAAKNALGVGAITALGAAIGSLGGPIGAVAGGIVGNMVGGAIFKSYTASQKLEQELQRKRAELQRKEEAEQKVRIQRMNKTLDSLGYTVASTQNKLTAGSSGGVWSGISSFFSNIFGGSKKVAGEVKHTGGIVGQGPSRMIPRFHDGYMPNEVPAILQRGEAVLSRLQLSGLTKLLNVTQSIGKIGESFKSFKTDSIQMLASGLSGKKGGLGGAVSLLSGGLGNTLGNILGGKGGIGSAIKNVLGGATGGKGSVISSVLGKTGIGSFAKGIIGGKGVSTLLNKVPGGSMIGSLFGKGGGTKNIAQSAGKAVAGKVIGSAIGSVIPGAGTLVGGMVGSVAGKLLGGLFGKKKKATPVAQSSESPQLGYGGGDMYGGNAVGGQYGSSQSQASSAPPVVNVDMKPIEAQLQQLINLMRSGGIVVNLDGKKVGGGVLDSYSRG